MLVETREIILNEVKDYIILNKSIPKVIDIRKGRVELNVSEYVALFGTYFNLINEIVENHGNEIGSLCNKWRENKNNILNGVKELMDTLGRIPKQEEYIQYAKEQGHYQKLNWIFDDFNTIIKEIKGTDEFITVKFNEADVISNIKLLAKELGRTPGYREYLEYAKENNLCTNVRYYNSWNYYIKKAELDVHNEKFSKYEVIELFFKLKNRLGRVPLKEEFSKENKYPTAFLIDKYFGSYNDFLDLMGVPKNHRGKYELHELKRYLEVYKDTYGKNPTKYAFTLQGGPNPSIYSKRFGKWSTAIETLLGEEHFKHNQFAYQYKSNHGDIRPSYNEGLIDDLIGECKLEHEHDVYYKNIVECCRNYTMDFFIEDKYIIEVAGLISKEDFNSGGIRLTEKCKIEYLKNIYHKIRLIENTKYKFIIIFKNESMDSIRSKLSKISDEFNNIIHEVRVGEIMSKEIRKLPVYQ